MKPQLILPQSTYGTIRLSSISAKSPNLNYQQTKLVQQWVEKLREKKKCTVTLFFKAGILSVAHTPDGNIWIFTLKNDDSMGFLNKNRFFSMSEFEKICSEYPYTPEFNNNVFLS